MRSPKRRATSGSVRGEAGFTLLELIIVVTMIGILAAIALPQLIQMPRRADEAVLKTNLRTLREVIDQYYGDRGTYPETLDALVDEGYLRTVPYDPITNQADWDLVYEDPSAGGDEDLFPADSDDLAGAAPGIIDVHSFSEDLALDGTPYNEW